jgi:hypothetical protein
LRDKLIGGGDGMDKQEAARTLELIRSLMERTCQYQLLTARAGLAAGCLAGAAAFLFNPWLLDERNPIHFAAIWGLVFLGALLATLVGTLMRGRQRGERVWSRQARAVLVALAPAVSAAAVLTAFCFHQGLHLWLPGVWMLCYGQGALATAAYAPAPVCWLGWAMMLLGGLTLALGPGWATLMMGLVFGLGHIGLGAALLWTEQRECRLRLFKDVA